MVDERNRVANARRRRIIELTTQVDYLRPADIAKTLGVSPETIRRDLVALEESGALRRVHGGALAADTHTTEPSRTDRSVTFLQQKQQIGDIVAGMIGVDDVVFMDVGTTVEVAAQRITPAFRGSVITNSLAIGGILGERERIELYVAGGRVRVGEMTTYGPDTLAYLEKFNATVAFIGSGGIHPSSGMTDYSVEDVAVKQLMVERSQRSYILATGDKFGVQAKRFVVGLDEVDGVITDATVPRDVLGELRAAGVNVITPESVQAAEAPSA
ncbi:MAG TPA: DeoR/GlpR family DNA-binding transcription regulator [Nocardioides sp.]|nr:DeoR/GlpR family DNA-binding transcription regulator [Nocardioides sp.]